VSIGPAVVLAGCAVAPSGATAIAIEIAAMEISFKRTAIILPGRLTGCSRRLAYSNTPAYPIGREPSSKD
jgi:hypothetical protein